MVLNNNELSEVSGGGLKSILLIGLGSALSFVIGVFESFFAKSC